MNFTQKPIFNSLTNFAVILFFAGIFVLPSGYSWGGVLLLVLALIYIVFNVKEIKLAPKWIILSFVIYFLANVFSYFIQQPKSAVQIDLASRFLLVIPVLIFLINQKINLKNIVIASSIGAISAFFYAYYQVNIAEIGIRAHGSMQYIVFAQLSMLWAFFSLSGIVLLTNFKSRKEKLFLFLFLLGFAGGLGASILSGSKGAWIFFPVGLVVFLFIFKKILNIKFLLALLGIIMAFSFWFFTTDNIVKNRTLAAINEIKAYQNDPEARYGSIGPRLQMYKVGILLFKESPVKGVGRENKDLAIQELNISAKLKDQIPKYLRLHNDFVDIAAIYGLIVLIPFLILLASSILFFIKHVSSEKLQVVFYAFNGFILCLDYFFAGMTDTMFGLNGGVMTFSIGVAIFASQIIKIKSEQIQ